MIRICSVIYSLVFAGCAIVFLLFLLHVETLYEGKNSGQKKMEQTRYFPKKELFLYKTPHQYVYVKLTADHSKLEADSLESKVKLQEVLENLQCSIASQGATNATEMRSIEADSGILDYNKMTLETLNTVLHFSDEKKSLLSGKASHLCIDFTQNPPHFEAKSFSGSYHAQ